MVKIKLLRTGAKHKASFRIVANEARSKMGGKALETLGYYYSQKGQPILKISRERLDWWLSHGAQLTPSVRRLLNNEKNP
jgi:small subunit ribosomal protein S16